MCENDEEYIPLKEEEVVEYITHHFNEDFYELFYKRLVEAYGESALKKDEGVREIWNFESTCGFCDILRNTMKDVGLEEELKWYKSLGWIDGDIADGYLDDFAIERWESKYGK